MSSICPLPYNGLSNTTGIQHLNDFLTWFQPFFCLICFCSVYSSRNSSIYLRKTELDITALNCCAVFPFWLSTGVYNSIGPENFPCGVFVFLFYIGYPAMAFPVIISVSRYRADVSNQRLVQENISMRASKRNLHLTEDFKIQGKISCEVFLAHLRVVFCGSRNKSLKLLNAQFSKTIACQIWWLSFITFPFLLAFIIRFTLSPKLQNCWACELDEIDLPILIGLWTFFALSGAITLPFKTDMKRDPLMKKRNSAIATVGSLPFFLIGLVLLYIDPDDINEKGLFSWRLLVLLVTYAAVYFWTIHQVFLSKSLKRQLLGSSNFNREDLFQDVLKDRELKKELINYLNSELSVEIILFIEACETFKTSYGNQSSEDLAKDIFTRFIKRGSSFEVNLSSKVREELLKKLINQSLKKCLIKHLSK